MEYVLFIFPFVVMALDIINLSKKKGPYKSSIPYLTISIVFAGLTTMALPIMILIITSYPSWMTIWLAILIYIFTPFFALSSIPFMCIGLSKSKQDVRNYRKSLGMIPETPKKAEPKVNADNQDNVTDDYKELIALKELLDKGVITQEEFDKKKKQILY